MMNKKTEFPSKVKKIISHRAGFKCSFPSCNKTLVGPGKYNNEIVNISEFCHIFSAAKNGPRGDGGLSKDQLEQPENGILLCRNHHKLIDSNNGNLYPPEVLIRYKNRHEFLIAAEIGEYLYPLNWINTVKMKKNDIFPNDIEINFGKLTHITGSGGTGKTTLLEIMQSCFEQSIVKRWENRGYDFEIIVSLDNPVINRFEFSYNENTIFYKHNNIIKSFVPLEYKVVALMNNLSYQADHLKMIADCFNFDRDFLKSFIKVNKEKIGITTRGYEIKTKRIRPYLVEELYIDVGNNRMQKFTMCSGSEMGRVIYDIAISIADELSYYKPVLLILDWLNISIGYDNILEKYLRYLTSHEHHYQVIMITTGIHKKDIWLGWETVNFIEDKGKVRIEQSKV